MGWSYYEITYPDTTCRSERQCSGTPTWARVHEAMFDARGVYRNARRRGDDRAAARAEAE